MVYIKKVTNGVTIKEAKLVFLDQEQLKNYLNLRIKKTKLRVLHQQQEC